MNKNASSKTSNRFPVRRLTTLALLTAAALMIYGLESLIPPLGPVPGIKLGLANVVTLTVIKRYGIRDAFLVLLARILLSGFFFGSLMSMSYSLCGGMLCLLTIWLINLLLMGHFLFLTSCMGAIAHNLAQLCVAYFITKTAGVFAYLPFLMISGVVTGLFTGMCAHFTLCHLPRPEKE